MLWKKNKGKKVNKEFEEIQDSVKLKKALGDDCAYLPISARALEDIKEWCSREGFVCEVDHMDENGIIFYKIGGWN